MHAPQTERRKETRRRCKSAVMIENLDPAPSGSARIRNYSRYGFYIEANQRHPTGANLFVGMENSLYKPIHRHRHQCHCMIVKWRRRIYDSEYLFGYGLEHRDPPCNCAPDVTVPIYAGDFSCGKPEQRKHSRRFLCKPVYFNAGENIRQGLVRNISRGGIFIETAGRFPIGGGIKLVIPNTRSTRQRALHGRIVRADGLGLGIQFTGLVKRSTPSTDKNRR